MGKTVAAAGGGGSHDGRSATGAAGGTVLRLQHHPTKQQRRGNNNTDKGNRSSHGGSRGGGGGSGRPEAARRAAEGQRSGRLLLKPSEHILPDAMLTFQDAFDEDGHTVAKPWEREHWQRTRRSVMPLALALNVLTLCTGYLAFRAVFCNSVDCVYEGPNTVCAFVEIADEACVTDPYACNCGSGGIAKANDFCNVANNNCACGWDGGDCCKPHLAVDECDGDATTAHLCDCLDPNFSYPCNGVCGVPAQEHDGVCDDSNNNCGCGWDGGDCCFTSMSCAYCGPHDCDYRFKNFFEDCASLLADDGCTCDGCASCFADPAMFSRCLDCQCLDPQYSVRSNNYSYHRDFVDLYRNNETYESFTRDEVCGGGDSAFVVEDYAWPEACECPCAYARFWYVNFGWVIVFAIVYFFYLLESCILHTLEKVKNPAVRNCVDRVVTKHMLYSATLTFKSRGHKHMMELRQAVPTVKLVLANYRSEQHYKARTKPLRAVSAVFKYTKWRDVTPDLTGVQTMHFVRLELTPQLAFDGYSTLRQFEAVRKRLLDQHGNPEFYQVYTERFHIPGFAPRTFRVGAGGVFLSTLFYLVFTIAGFSWFFRMFVEFGSSEFVVNVTKLMSMNDYVPKRDEDWQPPPSHTTPTRGGGKSPSARRLATGGQFAKSPKVRPSPSSANRRARDAAQSMEAKFIGASELQNV